MKGTRPRAQLPPNSNLFPSWVFTSAQISNRSHINYTLPPSPSGPIAFIAEFVSLRHELKQALLDMVEDLEDGLEHAKEGLDQAAGMASDGLDIARRKSVKIGDDSSAASTSTKVVPVDLRGHSPTPGDKYEVQEIEMASI